MTENVLLASGPLKVYFNLMVKENTGATSLWQLPLEQGLITLETQLQTEG